MYNNTGYKAAGTVSTAQNKLDNYFATQSAKRQTRSPCKPPERRDISNLPNPLAEIKKLLNIREQEEPKPVEVKPEEKEEKRTSHFGFISQTQLNFVESPKHKPGTKQPTGNQTLHFGEDKAVERQVKSPAKDPHAKRTPIARQSKAIKKDT